MKKIFLIAFYIISFAGLIAQQKNEIKLLKADESGFINVDKSPELIKAPVPVYPEKAKMQAIEGKVFLKLLIDENGNVAKAKIDKSVNRLLDKSAMDAVKRAKFSPALIKDKPVKAWVVLPIAFKLDIENNEKQGYPGMNDSTKVDEYPKFVNFVRPDYPAEAKKNKIIGKVYLKVLVDKDGIPQKAVVIKTDNSLFNQPAINATMKSKFTPALLNKEPIAVWVVLPYRFTLDEKEGNTNK
jgi:TonB family protein